MKRCLGLDVGEVRIGVAITDPLGLFAQPLRTLHRKIENVQEVLQDMIASYDIDKIIVGYPLRMSGEQGPACQKMDAFVASLALPEHVDVITLDERLTSKQAEKMLIHAGMRRERRKGCIDQIAAALLLQTYLDRQIPSFDL